MRFDILTDGRQTGTTMRKTRLTYTEALARDRDLCLRQRNNLAKLTRDLIDRIGDRGQEHAIKAIQIFLADIGLGDDDATN